MPSNPVLAFRLGVLLPICNADHVSHQAKAQPLDNCQTFFSSVLKNISNTFLLFRLLTACFVPPKEEFLEKGEDWWVHWCSLETIQSVMWASQNAEEPVQYLSWLRINQPVPWAGERLCFHIIRDSERLDKRLCFLSSGPSYSSISGEQTLSGSLPSLCVINLFYLGAIMSELLYCNVFCDLFLLILKALFLFLFFFLAPSTISQNTSVLDYMTSSIHNLFNGSLQELPARGRMYFFTFNSVPVLRFPLAKSKNKNTTTTNTKLSRIKM